MPPASESLPPFVLFSGEHLVTLLVIVSVWVALVFRGRNHAAEAAVRGGRVLAVILVAYDLVETWIRWIVLDLPLSHVLPLHICGILFYVSAYTLWTRRPLAYEITYFWTFAGTSHSLITPDVATGFPTFRYFSFFISHGLLILAALYATFVLRLRPRPGSVWRALVAINLFAFGVGAANLVLDTNYMFLMAKPQASTLLDFLGPCPWSLLALEALALTSFTLWYLPFWLRDRLGSGGTRNPEAASI